MKNPILTASLIVLVLGIGAACDRADEEVIAEINGREVTASEFENHMELKRVSPDDERRREALLEEYLEREALADAIERSDTLDPGMIEAEMQAFRQQMLISRHFDQYLEDAVSEEALRNYYSENLEQYRQRRARVAHVMLRTTAQMEENERAAKLTTAHEVHSRATAGEPFEDLAREFSEDRATAEEGGEIGWVREGAVSRRFSEQVFGMEEGEVSEPFETEFGFHVVKLLEGPETIRQSFEQVRGDIRYQLRNEARRAETERLLSEISIERANED